MHPRFPTLTLIGHPLVAHALTTLRDRSTPPPLFRARLHEAAALMAFTVTADLPLATRRIETPLVAMEAPTLARPAIVVVSVLRAGLGMAAGLVAAIPQALEGHVGVYRDPATLRPVEYLVRLPPLADAHWILCDPMLATGNSAAHAVDVVKRHGARGADIRLLALVAAPEGVATFAARHPEVPVFAAALDERLDERAYILPGLGDAGDRQFGTEH